MTSPYQPIHVPMSFVFGLTAVHSVCFLLLGAALSALFRLSSGSSDVIEWHMVWTSLYVCETLALVTHWLGHRNINLYPFNLWYEAHTTGHHLQDYPPAKFLSNAYEPAKKDNSVAYIFALFLTPFFVVRPSLWMSCLASLSALKVVVVKFLFSWAVSYAMLISADTIHMALHVDKHPWERFQWFRYLRALHYHHHAGDRKRNYAIGDFFLDYLLLGFKN